jgi:hypothetical protein
MSAHIPKKIRVEIEERVKGEVSDYWYHGGAERVAEWAYRRGVKDGLRKPQKGHPVDEERGA